MAKTTVKTETKSSTPVSRGDRSHIIKRPRITEKATILSLTNTYVFEIATSATKRDVIATIRDLYKVVPEAVRIVRMVPKSVRSRKTGKLGVKRGGKKAYVTLKKGESITI